MIPSIDYGQGKRAEQVAIDPNVSYAKIKEGLVNIGTSFHCKGSLLTLSYQVMQKDEVRCYLFWNGMFLYIILYGYRCIL